MGIPDIEEKERNRIFEIINDCYVTESMTDTKLQKLIEHQGR